MKSVLKYLCTFLIMLGGFLSPIAVGVGDVVDPGTSFVSLELNQVYADDLANSAINFNCDGNLVYCGVVRGIMYIIELVWYRVTLYFAALSGFILDILLFHSVSSTSYRSGIIEAGWEILRNLTNIIFIFSLMMVAFKMVLGAGNGNAKKTLLKTILIALVINFSLYFSFLIIDSSNILANVFYNRIEVEDRVESNVDESNAILRSFFGDQDVKSPSSAIVNNFNPQRIVLNNNGRNLGALETFLMIVAAGGVNVLMIWVFVTIALLFLSRTVGLIMSAILSPIAFATLTIPSEKVVNMRWIGFNTWLNQLISLSFMAPVYLFFLYLIVIFSNDNAIFNSIRVVSSTGSGIQNLITTILGVLIPFAFIGILLYTAKKVSTSMAGEMGTAISGALTKAAVGTATIAAGGVALGATALSGAAGTGLRAYGAKKGNKRLENFGKGLQMTSFDISKMPGFKQNFGKTPFASKAAKMMGGYSARDVELGYRKAERKVRENIPGTELNNGRTKDRIEEWDKKINETRYKGTQEWKDDKRAFDDLTSVVKELNKNIAQAKARGANPTLISNLEAKLKTEKDKLKDHEDKMVYVPPKNKKTKKDDDES